MRAHITLFPWDVLDERADAVLDRLQGEVGATGVTLWAACPEVMLWRAREVEPRMVRFEGGLLFAPSMERFDATRVKPVVSTRWRSHDAPAAMTERCAARGLTLRLMISASRIGRLAEKYPETATKNALDDASQRSVCLNHPDVREFLRGSVLDISRRYPSAGLVVTDFTSSWSDAVDDRWLASVPLDDTDRFLLSICFCESCRQGAMKAELDPAGVHRCVNVLLSRRCAGKSGPAWSIQGLLEEHAPLRAYVGWQSNELGILWRGLAESHGGEFVRDRPLRRPLAMQSAAPSGTVVSTIVESLEELPEAISDTGLGGELRFASELTTRADAADLVRATSMAVERGVVGVTFDTWSLWSNEALDSVRQAIRYARRVRA